MTKIKLRDHEEIEGVGIYYERTGQGDRFFYSRNGKQFFPKAGEYSADAANNAATEAQTKARAAKRKPLSLAVVVIARDNGGVRTKGTCTGYTLQHDGGLSVKTHGRFSSSVERVGSGRYGETMPRVTTPDNPALERIEARRSVIAKARQALNEIEGMQEADVKASTFQPPDKPSGPEARANAEAELQKLYDDHAASLGDVALRTAVVGNDLDDPRKIPKWSKPATFASVFAAADSFGAVSHEGVTGQRHSGTINGLPYLLRNALSRVVDRYKPGRPVTQEGIEVAGFLIPGKGKEGSERLLLIATPEAVAQLTERLTVKTE